MIMNCQDGAELLQSAIIKQSLYSSQSNLICRLQDRIYYRLFSTYNKLKALTDRYLEIDIIIITHTHIRYSIFFQLCEISRLLRIFGRCSAVQCDSSTLSHCRHHLESLYYFVICFVFSLNKYNCVPKEQEVIEVMVKRDNTNI